MIKLKDLLLEKLDGGTVVKITMLGSAFKNKFRIAVIKKQDKKIFKILVKSLESHDKRLKYKTYPGLDEYDGPQFKLNYKISFENAFDEVRKLLKAYEKHYGIEKGRLNNQFKDQVVRDWVNEKYKVHYGPQGDNKLLSFKPYHYFVTEFIDQMSMYE